MNVTVHEKELVAIVGSSGSGKSLLAHGILGILPYNSQLNGEIHYMGENLTPEKIKKIRGKEIVLIPQSTAYLDPLMKVGTQMRKSLNDPTSKKKSEEVLTRYGLHVKTQNMYPFQLSGGMARRILISTAMIENPKLVIADEPTPGIHVSTAKKILSDFREIADDNAGVLFITHDLELALEVADKIVVFYAGMTIEEAKITDFQSEETLRHPYTKSLWKALPQNGFNSIDGTQPYSKDLPKGCPFEPRCYMRSKQCLTEIAYRAVRGGYVRCLYAE